MLQIQLSGIKKIEEKIRDNADYISLSQGSLKIGGIPQQIKNYVQKLLDSDTTDYYDSCWGIAPLREKLQHVLSQRYQTTVSRDSIIPTHGCIGGLSILYLSILEPGDEVLIPEPCYPAYKTLAQAARAKVNYVSVEKKLPSGITTWELEVEKIKAATTEKTKIILFSNPWNPLGMIVPEKTIKELVAWCEEKEIYLIIDEAYNEYVFEKELTPIVPLTQTSKWVISANTFSKNMAMSGWRIGYLVVPEHLAPALAGMQDALLNCLNNTAQYAAICALEHPEFTQEFKKIIQTNRDLTLRKLEPLLKNNTLELVTPNGGFFAFLKTQEADATQMCANILKNAHVSLVPGKSFGPSGAPYLRLCYARDTQVLEEGLQRLVDYFK